MIIIKDTKYSLQLLSILKYIAKDKLSSAKKFEKELKQKFVNLLDFPYQYRQSLYFEDESYRDLVYQGYTIIYKVEEERVLILEIFKWIER